jgi:DNA-binding MarR family transcriptional regulator
MRRPGGVDNRDRPTVRPALCAIDRWSLGAEDASSNPLRQGKSLAIRRPNLARRRALAASGPAKADLAMDGFITVRIVQLAEVISRGASQVFETRFGVKNTELRILVHLGRGPLAVNELARRTHVDKGWISRSLKGLEDRGLVERTPHPTDSRASLVRLTDEGEALTRSFAPVAAARNRRLLAGLDEGEVRRTFDALMLRAEDILMNPNLSGPEPLPPLSNRPRRRRDSLSGAD